MTKKRVTSFDVASKSGVSRATVSFVLNNVTSVRISEETRKRVFAAAQELGYHPDSAGRKLASGKSDTIGLVLHQSQDQVFADALLPQVVLGMGKAAAENGFHILMMALEPNDSQGYMGLIQENHVDGIILSGPQANDHELVNLYHEGFPIILMGQLPETDLPFVDIDAIAGARQAVSHLIENGHRRIAMITNAPLEYTSAKQRYVGYQLAFREIGVEMDDSLLREGSFTPASGYKRMKELLQLKPRPTAVFVASDVVAMGAIQAIKEAGLCVPDDIAMTGFDDIPLAEYFDPPLTTVHIPSFNLGWEAGENLIRLIKGGSLEKQKVILNSELILRESSRRKILVN